MSATVEPPSQLAVGLHKDISFVDYCAIPAMNWHTLEPYRKSALTGRYRQLHGDEDTKAKHFGAAFHSAVLEPARFAAEYAVMPQFEGDYRTKAYKDAKAVWEAQNATKVHLKTDEYEELLAMHEAVRAHPLASAILFNSKGASELTAVWDDKQTGRRCKGRVDRLAAVPIALLEPTAPDPLGMAFVMADLKSTRSADPRDFERDFARYAYHGQFGFYDDGLHAIRRGDVTHYSIAVEKKPPYEVVVYRVTDEALAHGKALYRRLLDRLTACEKAKAYPGISDVAVPLYLPEWSHEGDPEGEDD